MGIFETDADTIGFDDESIGQRLPTYSPQIVGATDRLMILSPVKKCLGHFIEGAGFVKCTGGKCCEQSDDPPKFRLGVVAFQYETDRNGSLPKDSNNEPIVRGDLVVIIMTDNMYARFREANKRASSDSDGKEHLNSVDTLISVESEHKKEWKQWTISLSRRSFYLTWAKRAKSEKNPEGDETIAKELAAHKVRMRKLWEVLPRELGREFTDEELMAKLAKGGKPVSPDDLPDVGDPTDALGDLD